MNRSKSPLSKPPQRKPLPSKPGWRGYLLIAGAAFFWGLSGAVARLLFIRSGGTPVDPLILSQTRSSFAFLILLAYAVAARRDLLRVSMRDALGLALLGLGGIAASNYTYFQALQLTNVTTAILVQYTAPVWIMFYSVLFAGERLTPAKVLAVALSFTGCFLALGAWQTEVLRLNAVGIAYAFGAAFSFCFFNILGGRMSARVNVRTSLLYSLGAATLFWFCVNPPGRIIAAGFGWRDWLTFAGYSLISILIPFALYYAGLKWLRPTHAVITATLEPIFAIFFAFLLVGERISPFGALGAFGVVGAVILLQKRDL